MTISAGDTVVLVGVVRDIDNGNAVVVVGANGEHAIRADKDAVIDIADLGGGAVWGAITGKIASQSDLSDALAEKAPLDTPVFTGPAGSTSAPTLPDHYQRGTDVAASQAAQDAVFLALLAGYQPASATLVALSGLSTTSFGHDLLEGDRDSLQDVTGPTPTRGREFTHFIGNDARMSGFYGNNSGSGSSVWQGWEYVTTASGWLGAMKIETGTTSTGRACMHVGSNALIFGQSHAYSIETLAAVESLSTVSEEFVLWYGFMDQLEGATVPSRGAFFRYDRLATGDSNWRAVTRNGGVETVTDTGIAVAPGFGAGFRMRVVVDLDGGEARFYIDSVLVATHTTNINATQRHGYGMKIVKSAGTTELGAGFDWHEFRWSGADDLD